MSATGFRILRSTDGGAPTLNGTAGALIGVIDALLDIGSSGSFWEKVYSGTNKAAYRADSGERYYLRVDDSAAQVAAVRGYTTMSNVDTGTDAFPTTTQQTNWNWFKSNTADSTARAYTAVATDRFFLILVSGGWSGSGQELYFFGEPKKFNAADAGASCIKAHPAASFGTSSFRGGLTTSSSPFALSTAYTAPANNNLAMLPMALNADGATPSASGRYFGTIPTTSVPFASYGFILPTPIIIGSAISGAAGLARGALPHIYCTCNYESDANLAQGDTFSDADGREFLLCAPAGTSTLSNAQPLIAIMTSDSEVGAP